jgi:hypothetical protein
MAKKSSRLEIIKGNIRKILTGVIKQNPKYDYENYKHPCPFCEGVNLEFDHERGSDPYTESIYLCPKCEKFMSYSYLSQIQDAYTAMDGNDPYQGEIWVDSENSWWTPPKHHWEKIVEEIKREIEQENKK